MKLLAREFDNPNIMKKRTIELQSINKQRETDVLGAQG